MFPASSQTWTNTPIQKSNPIILNFAIKDDWKDPSKVEWIEETLQKFVDNYKKLGITSIAFPWMGAMNGGLPIEIIKDLTRKYLSKLEDIDIEVYEFDPNIPCELYNSLENIVVKKNVSMSYLEEVSGIKVRYWTKIFDAVNSPTVNSLNNLCNYYVEGKRIIGKTNIERLFHFLTSYKNGNIVLNESFL